MVAIAALLLPTPALAFNLVTEEEVAASAQYEAAHPKTTLPRRTRSLAPSTPRIEIVSPDLSSGSTFQSPLRILVKFQTEDKAEIVPETFRAEYGGFHIDITGRLLKSAKVTKEGISVDKAELPPGNHRLVLKVQDSAERTAEREVRFTVQ